MIYVRVPATSANVGCGFDTLGLALTLYATFGFEEIDEGLEIIGCEDKYKNENNLVYTSLQYALKHLNKKIKGVRIVIDSDVPNSRGLGSSAVCIVGGIVGAYLLTKSPIVRKDILQLATEVEGHPDNVAPAIWGGLCASVMKDGEVATLSHRLDNRLLFQALIPDYETKTADARNVLPKVLPYKDIIYSLSRLPLVIDALKNYDLQNLTRVQGDKLHEPYRETLIHEFEDVKKICQTFDSVFFYISGSGSTLMNIVKDEANLLFIENELKQLKHNWRSLHLKPDNEGFKILQEVKTC